VVLGAQPQAPGSGEAVLPDRQAGQATGGEVVGHRPTRHDRQAEAGAHHAGHRAEVVELHDDAREDTGLEQRPLDQPVGRAAPLVDQQRLARQLAHLHPPPAGERMAGGGDHHQLVAADLEDAQLRLVDRQRQHGDVEVALQEMFDRARRGAAAHPQLDARELLVEGLQDRRQQVFAGGAAGADAQDAGAGGVVHRQHALRLVDLGEDLAGVVQEQLAGRRRPDAGAGAHQQLDAELALLGGDLLADRRLAETEAAAGAGEAAHVDDGDEGPQQARVELGSAAFDRRLRLRHLGGRLGGRGGGHAFGGSHLGLQWCVGGYGRA